MRTIARVATVLLVAGAVFALVQLVMDAPFGNGVHVPKKATPVQTVSMRSYRTAIHFERAQAGDEQEGRFVARGLGHRLEVGPDGITVRSLSRPGRAGFDIEFHGRQSNVRPEGSDTLASYSSYFRGNSSSDWVRRSPHFASVRYVGVYPGVDVSVYGTDNQTLEFDFIVQPGADPRSIALRLDGADTHHISTNGELEIIDDGDRFVLRAPIVFQEVGDTRRSIDSKLVAKADGSVAFEIGRYDPDLDLIIDPELVYSTRLGGSGGEIAQAVALYPDGSAVVVGITGSTDFPPVNAYATDIDGNLGDVFVTKFDPKGQPLFSTYLGGSKSEFLGCDAAPPSSVGLDPNGNIWIVGRTTSEDFPPVNALQDKITPTPGRETPKPDVFVANMTSSGDDLLFSTYYGGEGLDEACGIDVDVLGNVFFVGMTESEPFPPEGNDQTKKGAFDAFAVKLNPDHSIAYSRYVGGNEVLFYEKATDVVAGADGSAYVVGYSDAPDFPPVPAEKAVLDGETDAFLVKLNPDGSMSNVAVDLGGSLTEIAHGVGLDETNGYVAVVGITASSDFPADGGPFSTPADLGNQFKQNGFMSVFDLAGETVWSSYVGGSGTDYAFQVALTENGRGYVVGSTASSDFPPEGALQGPSESVDAVADGYLVEVDVASPSLEFWTFIGGAGLDHAYAVDAHPAGGVVVAGVTYSNDYPPVNAYQSEVRANDAFVLKFAGESEPGIAVTPNPVQFPVTLPGETSTRTVTITSSGTAPLEIQNVDVEPTTVFSLRDEPEFPITLDPGGTLMLDVDYSPQNPAFPAGKATGLADDEGTLTVINNSPTPILAVPLKAGGIIVNEVGDESDPTPDDGNCDVDAGMAGNQCTLRAAIQTVNSLKNDDVTQVAFNIPADAPQIRIVSELPPVSYPINLDGTTQPGAGVVRVWGQLAPDEANGLRVEGGNSVLRGLSIENFKVGIILDRKPFSRVEGCQIIGNTDSGIQVFGDDQVILGNTIYANRIVGVYIGHLDEERDDFVERVLVEDNTIGSETDPQDTGILIAHFAKADTLRNNVVVFHKRSGIWLHSTEGHVVEKNDVGTNRLGQYGLGNAKGILLTESTTNRVSDNTISGNIAIGLEIKGGENNTVSDNKIGTDQVGAFTPVPNGDVGVLIKDSSENTIKDNVISNTDGVGLLVVGDSYGNQIVENKIGTNVNGDFRMPNRFHGVEIRGTGPYDDVISPSQRNNVLSDNIISGNRLSGISVGGLAWVAIARNLIGVGSSGATAIPNDENGIELTNAGQVSISNNTISGNELDGIRSINGVGRLSINMNRIGTDDQGLQPVGNGRNGIRLSRQRAFVSNNVISANERSGVLLSGEGQSGATEIGGNKIGSDVNKLDPLGTMGNGANGIHIDRYRSPKVIRKLTTTNNFIAYNQENGIFMDSSDRIDVQGNEIRRNVVGIRLQGGERVSVWANRIHLNVRNIDATDSDRQTIIESNDVFDGTGQGTGLHATSASMRIQGNYFSGDAGDAVTLEQGSAPLIERNTFSGNAGFGVNNLDLSTEVDARANWWGDDSGPGGDGPGSGDEVSASVDFSDWLAAPIGVTLSVVPDTFVVAPGTEDTAVVYVQNWLDRDDVVQVSIFDTEGWLTSLNAFEVSLIDSMAARVEVALEIPSTAADGDESVVTVLATSRSDGSNAADAELVVRVSAADLVGLIVAPDSSTVAVGDTTYFVAEGFDQFGGGVETIVNWFAEGGAIDETGMYIAGSETGAFEVTATTGFGGLQATSTVIILESLVAAEDEAQLPERFVLHPNYPNPFNPSTTIAYDVPQAADLRIAVYDALGRRVAVLGAWHRAPGTYSVTWDATGFPSGLYFFRLETKDFVQTRKMLLIR